MENEYQEKYFKMMLTLSKELSSIPALILEQSYTYEAFGSWWFSYKKSGTKYRIAFDGRDEILRIETQDVRDWNTEGEVKIQSDEDLTIKVLSLINKY